MPVRHKKKKKKKIKKFIDAMVTRVDADVFSESADCDVVRNHHRPEASSVLNCTGSLVVCSFFFPCVHEEQYVGMSRY